MSQEVLNALCREQFSAFAAKAFEIVNPGIPFEWNWHLDCLSDHLQSLYDGTLPDGKRRLCINVPPRSLKSYLASIAFPAWVIGKEAHKKFIATSFNATLAKEMAQKSRILIESDWYKQLFPFTKLDSTQNEKHNFWTTQRGMYYSSAIASVTGRGADYCFIGSTKILTRSSYKRIDKIRVNDLVWSYNHETKRAELKRVTNIFARRVPRVVQVKTTCGSKIISTPDHPFWVSEQGYREAETLCVGAALISARLRPNENAYLRIAMRFLCKKVREIKGRLSEDFIAWAPRTLLLQPLFEGSSQYQEQTTMRSMWREDGVQAAKILPDMQVKGFQKDIERVRQTVCGSQGVDRLSRWIQMCLLFVKGVSDYSPFRRRQEQQFTIELVNPMQGMSHDASSRKASAVQSVSKMGDGEYTVYDITVEGNHNFFAEGILVHNCILDDPVNPTEAYSQTIRENTNAEIAGTIPTRFNDLRVAKWLLIMQRLHDDDPTGHFALKDDRWHILKLPGENKTGKPISYTLGSKTWTIEPDELLFPVRLTRQVLDELRTDLGDYNYAGQILQEPVPIGGGELQGSWIQYYSQGSIKPKTMNVIILVDPSGGFQSHINKQKQKNSDRTFMGVIGLSSDNNRYLLDCIADKLNPTERVDTLFMLHRKWNELCGKPPKVGWEHYSMQGDLHYIEEKKKQDAYHFPLIPMGGSMKKEDRIRRLIPDLQNGRWYFPQSLLYVDIEGRVIDIVKEIRDSEMPTFPRAKHDDGLDMLSRIYEEDLNMVFPRPKVSMVEKAFRPKREEQSWETF